MTTVEMLNILVPTTVWNQKWANSTVRIACNNEAVVKVLNTGRTKCPQLGEIARNIFIKVAPFDIDLYISNI